MENTQNNDMLPQEDATNEVRPSKRKQSTPTNDGDMLAVLTSQLQQWDENRFRVEWMTKERLQTITDAFTEQLNSRNRTGASRGAISKELSKLDEEIDVSIEFVKNRLAERLHSKSEAIARYREFGIVKDKSYKLPQSREHRGPALQMLIEALGVYQFGDTDFGVSYWTDIHTRYTTLVAQARMTDGSVSSKVADLKGLRAESRKFLTSFTYIIRGNFPDTWQQKLREFGFQKEKY